MWCACPTRSPHSPSASSCSKPIPLLNLRPSPAEWAPYPTARTVPRMCERFFCTPAQVPPAFLRQTPAYSCPEPPPSRTKFPPPLAHPRRRAENSHILAPSSRIRAPFLRLRTPSSHLRSHTLRRRAENTLILAPNSHLPAPFLRLRTPSSHLRSHIPRRRAELPPSCTKFPPPLAHSPPSHALSPHPSAHPPPGAEAKPLIGTTRPPAASTPSPHPTQKRPNLTPSRRKNVTLSTHSF